jgi:hypothetical protein
MGTEYVIIYQYILAATVYTPCCLTCYRRNFITNLILTEMLDIVGINSKKLEQLETDGVTYRLKGNEDTCQEAVEDFIEEKSFTQTMLEWLNLQSESIQPLGFAMCKNFNRYFWYYTFSSCAEFFIIFISHNF